MFDNLSLFARLTLFAGMFFASVPGLVEGGGAGGDGGAGGGDEGGGDDGDTTNEGAEGGTSDAGDEDISEEDDVSGSGDGDHDEGDGDDEGEGEGGEKKIAGPSEAQFRKALDEVKKVDPKLADVLRKDHYSLGDYRKVGSLSEVREMAETLEDVGGVEGISTMKGKVVDYANELMAFAEGKPEVIDELFRDYPEGGFKLVPLAINKIKALEMDEATGYPKPNGQYARMQARFTAESLDMFGAYSAMEDLLRIAHDGGANAQQRTVEKATALKAWMDGVKSFARQRQQADDAQGGKSKLDQERAEIQKQKVEMYRERIGTAVMSNMDAVINRFLTPKLRDYAKATGKALRAASKQDVMAGARTRMTKALEGNSRYQTQVGAMVRAGDDPDKIGRFCRTYMEKLGEKVIDGVWATKGHANARRGGKSNAAAGGGSGNARVTTGTKPPAHKIDWSKDPSRMRYMSGEATLLKQYGGGVHKWDRNAL